MKDKNNELEHTLFQLEEAVSNLQRLTSGFVQDVEWANKKVKKNPFLIARLRADNERARNKRRDKCKK
tara:strand:- start:602 stop:805 length:204 start_codon:yes stop_codon:yes gene_type:complete